MKSPMANYDDPVLKRQHILLCKQHVKIVLNGAALPHNRPYVIDETIIISYHSEGEVQASGRYRHIEKIV